MPYINDDLLNTLQKGIIKATPKSRYSAKTYSLAEELFKEAQMLRDPRPSEIERAVGTSLDEAERWVKDEVIDKNRGSTWLASKLNGLLQELRTDAVFGIGKALSTSFPQLLTPEVSKILSRLGSDPHNIEKYMEKDEEEEASEDAADKDNE